MSFAMEYSADRAPERPPAVPSKFRREVVTPATNRSLRPGNGRFLTSVAQGPAPVLDYSAGRIPERPPAVLGEFRREVILPTTVGSVEGRPIPNQDDRLTPAPHDSVEIARDGTLEEGQRELRAARAREDEIRRYPGVEEVTLQDVAAFCIKESGIPPTAKVANALARVAQVSMEPLNKDIYKEDDSYIVIRAHLIRSGTRHLLNGTVFCTSLAHYNRTLVPDPGLRTAYAVQHLADKLVVVDPVHAHWVYQRRNITPRRLTDPMLLAIVTRPYAGAPGTALTDATLLCLCTWK